MNNDNILIITKDTSKISKGGREILSDSNINIIKSIFSSYCHIYYILNNKITSLSELFNAFRGYIDGLNYSIIQDIIKYININNIKIIYIDGSNFGELARILKAEFENIKIITFFHNVEAVFFWGAFIKNKTVRSLLVLIVNYLSEKKAVKYSDELICLSQREINKIEILYKKNIRKHIVPLSLKDLYVEDFNIKDNLSKVDPYLLFVGGNFYANTDGIEWFIKNVVPFINIKLYIVGRGMEKYINKYNIPNRVYVLGEVQELQNLYINALCVIAPIFIGSGMKTKVAEAIMFGKHVIGTSESFSGYEDIIQQVGWRCNSANDFISVINSIQIKINNKNNKNIRRIFLNNYSQNASKNKFKVILKNES